MDLSFSLLSKMQRNDYLTALYYLSSFYLNLYSLINYNNLSNIRESKKDFSKIKRFILNYLLIGLFFKEKSTMANLHEDTI